jgi:hypothetical protein
MLMALIHAASAELQAARVDERNAADALVSTVLGAIGDGPIPRSPSRP